MSTPNFQGDALPRAADDFVTSDAQDNITQQRSLGKLPTATAMMIHPNPVTIEIEDPDTGERHTFTADTEAEATAAAERFFGVDEAQERDND